METPNKRDLEQDSVEVETHIAAAHQLLKALEARIGEQHPEIGAAITKIEMALNVLAIKTGGLL